MKREPAEIANQVLRENSRHERVLGSQSRDTVRSAICLPCQSAFWTPDNHEYPILRVVTRRAMSESIAGHGLLCVARFNMSGDNFLFLAPFYNSVYQRRRLSFKVTSIALCSFYEVQSVPAGERLERNILDLECSKLYTNAIQRLYAPSYLSSSSVCVSSVPPYSQFQLLDPINEPDLSSVFPASGLNYTKGEVPSIRCAICF
ncbi:hypothetical protein J3R30DRAFT_844259 [Lentinula aciculospora]|uniref:Uncharacterized protein n=1 Tax=Lentinula aciculospora TaxID=153920 RepID=A0A9W9DVD6_9AGAR|nr:hypothetical protein J3R30DRAFT_844259 [Lentinula aciculospora]